MPTRDEEFQAVMDKHERRLDMSARSIMDTDNVLGARTALKTAVRSLPGVSDDPHTVPDILRLMDTYNTAVRLLSEDS